MPATHRFLLNIYQTLNDDISRTRDRFGPRLWDRCKEKILYRVSHIEILCGFPTKNSITH